jgi:lipopolysaccharide biosynthesis glycosyltransferase
MTSACILYITDETYFFPTLVSAIQARQQTSRQKADVIIFHLGVDEATERDFAKVCAAEDIRLLAIDPKIIEGSDAMMARLLLNRFVPEQYTQYLYIDGDVHITGSLDELIDAEVPEGCFMAANDPMTFQLSDNDAASRDLLAHLQSIGFAPEQAKQYFNTGVLRINRVGWDEIGQRAWEMARDPKAAFRFPDQDPLNIVGASRRLPMSLAWNFPIFMRHARVEAEINPRVYHFMSRPKPWQGVFLPWKFESYSPYEKTMADYPQLARYRSTFSFRRRLRYHLQQRYKKILETLSWGYSKRRGRILNYEGHVTNDGRAAYINGSASSGMLINF